MVVLEVLSDMKSHMALMTKARKLISQALWQIGGIQTQTPIFKRGLNALYFNMEITQQNKLI